MRDRTSTNGSLGTARLPDYLEAADTYYDETYLRLKSSRDRAWIIAAASSLLTALAIIALTLLTPLKRVDLVPVIVDKSTGEAKVMRQLTPGPISEQESVHKADLAAYVIARESFDRAMLKHHYRAVQSRSTAAVLLPLTNALRPNVPGSLYERYANATREIEVRSIVLLGEKLGQVRFSASFLRAGDPPVVTSYIASVGFEYVNASLSVDQRLLNPLGFVVTSYRIDQESLPQENTP